MNKRGQGLSTNAIILIVLGVVVLVVLIGGFTIGWGQMAPWIKTNKKADPDMRIPQDLEIHEEAESWARLGLYPLIHEAAKKSYKKGIPNCMNELAKLCKDKSLNFDAPAKQFIKKIFKGIFK